MPYKSKREHALYMRRWRRRKAREQGLPPPQPRPKARKYHERRGSRKK